MPNTPRKTAAKKTAAKKPAGSALRKPETGAEILARVQPRRRVESTKVCLRSDLIHEMRREDELLAEMQQPSGRNAGGAYTAEQIKAQARKVRRLEEQVVESQIEFVFTGLSKDAFRALVDNHGPRKGNNVDVMVGYNRDAVLDALVRQSLTSPVFEDCMVEVETGEPCSHEDCGTWQQLTATINPSEWGELRDTANEANSAVTDAPKSVLASLILDRRSSASQ